MNILAGRMLPIVRTVEGLAISVGFDKAGAPTSSASTPNGSKVTQTQIVQAAQQAASGAVDSLAFLHVWLQAINTPEASRIVAPTARVMAADLTGLVGKA